MTANSGGSRTPSASGPPLVLALAAASLVLAGCAGLSGGHGFHPARGMDRMQVRISPAVHFTGGRPFVDFWVSEPAYVTVFSLVPGGFIEVVHPSSPAAPARFGEGYHGVVGYSGFASRSRRAGFVGFPGARACGFGSPYGGYGVGLPDRLGILFVVASSRPLRTSRIEHMVAYSFGFTPMGSYRLFPGEEFAAMDRLAERLLPAGISGSEWDADWIYQLTPARRCSRSVRAVLAAPPPEAEEPPADSTGERTEPTLPFDPRDFRIHPPVGPGDPPVFQKPEGERVGEPSPERLGRLAFPREARGPRVWTEDGEPVPLQRLRRLDPASWNRERARDWRLRGIPSPPRRPAFGGHRDRGRWTGHSPGAAPRHWPATGRAGRTGRGDAGGSGASAGTPRSRSPDRGVRGRVGGGRSGDGGDGSDSGSGGRGGRGDG